MKNEYWVTVKGQKILKNKLDQEQKVLKGLFDGESGADAFKKAEQYYEHTLRYRVLDWVDIRKL